MVPTWFLWGIVSISLNMFLCEKKNRNKFNWAIAGLAFGLFSTVFLGFMDELEE